MSDCIRCDYCDELIDGNYATVNVFEPDSYPRRDGTVRHYLRNVEDRDCCVECAKTLRKYERIVRVSRAPDGEWVKKVVWRMHLIESWADEDYPAWKRSERIAKARRARLNRAKP